MNQTYPGIDPDISQWKGQDIVNFQEDLLRKVNGRLSEKWFYTHMKSPAPALPRIDTLDMLSRYAGYESWQEFKYKNNRNHTSSGKTSKAAKELLKISIIFITVTAVIFILIKLINTQNYRISFFDNMTGEPLVNDKIRVRLLLENESPVQYTADKNGKIVIRTNKGLLNMVVTAPYYLPDTLTRSLKKLIRNEKIGLDADSYALMISYFSDSDVNAWEKRREQLTRILHDDALIYRLSCINGDAGMELYNKQEFIDKLTMPSSSLRKIDILETRYLDDQIILIRFKVKEQNHE